MCWVRAVSSVSPAKVDVQQRAVQAHARGERLLCTGYCRYLTATTVYVQWAKGAASGRGGRWRCGCAAGKQGSRLARAGLLLTLVAAKANSSAVLQTCSGGGCKSRSGGVCYVGVESRASVDQKELLCCCFRMGDLAVAIGLPGAAGRAGGARPTRRPSSESAVLKEISLVCPTV